MEIGLPLDHRAPLHIIYYNKDSVSLLEQKSGKFYLIKIIKFLKVGVSQLWQSSIA